MTGDHGNSEMVEIHHPPASIPGREFDLLRAFAFGMNISECAIQLNISEPTAATYRTRLMTKLELMSTTSASRELLEPSSAETVKPLARLPMEQRAGGSC